MISRLKNDGHNLNNSLNLNTPHIISIIHCVYSILGYFERPTLPPINYSNPSRHICFSVLTAKNLDNEKKMSFRSRTDVALLC